MQKFIKSKSMPCIRDLKCQANNKPHIVYHKDESDLLLYYGMTDSINNQMRQHTEVEPTTRNPCAKPKTRMRE